MTGMYNPAYKPELFPTANSILSQSGSRTARPRTAAHSQELLIKEQLQNQTVRLREAFLREDARITGSVPSYMLSSCLRAGGLELSKEQTKEASYMYMTGEGRFNWIHFCDVTEKARKASWKQAARVKSAKAFADIDRDGSGRLSREELEQALKRWKVPAPKATLDKLIRSCDADGDGNISYPEFVDGFVKDMLAPGSIFGKTMKSGSLSARGSALDRKYVGVRRY